MSVWTTPATFATGAVTAASMNAEIRDHALFLKGSLDIISNSTTADTSDTMNLWIKRAAAASVAYSAGVTADANARWTVGANGDMGWGPATTAVDVTLKRSAVGTLRLDGILGLYNTATANTLTSTQSGDANLRFAMLGSGEQRWGDGTSAYDTAIMRDLANSLRLGEDDTLRLYGSVVTSGVFQTRVTADVGVRLHVRADGQMEWGDGAGTRDVVLQRVSANLLGLGVGDSLAVGATQVVAARQTGWGAPTGTATRTTFATSTVTTAQLAERVKALVDDLTTHGLIGA